MQGILNGAEVLEGLLAVAFQPDGGEGRGVVLRDEVRVALIKVAGDGVDLFWMLSLEVIQKGFGLGGVGIGVVEKQDDVAGIVTAEGLELDLCRACRRRARVLPALLAHPVT